MVNGYSIAGNGAEGIFYLDEVGLICGRIIFISDINLGDEIYVITDDWYIHKLYISNIDDGGYLYETEDTVELDENTINKISVLDIKCLDSKILKGLYEKHLNKN